MSAPRREIPSLKRSEIVRALHRAGFQTLRQRGSHEFPHHPDCRRLTIAIHPSAEAGPPIVKKIVRDSGLTREEFLAPL